MLAWIAGEWKAIQATSCVRNAPFPWSTSATSVTFSQLLYTHIVMELATAALGSATPAVATTQVTCIVRRVNLCLILLEGCPA